MPVFKQDKEVSSFSKSAPNLDKARICTTSTSSYAELGKSYDEGLCNVKSGNGNIDKMFETDNNQIQRFQIKNNKKYSLDSKAVDNSIHLTNRQLKSSKSFDDDGSMGYNNVHINNESLTYDKIFHKKMQKSLEILNSYISSPQENEQTAKVNWKSSDNLSSNLTSEHLEGYSQFQREEFFTNANFSNVSLISSNSILKNNNPFHFENSYQSTNENNDLDDISNRIRKTSVTFKSNSDDPSDLLKNNTSVPLKFSNMSEKSEGKVLSFYHKFNSRSHNLKTPQFVHKLKDKLNYNKSKKKKYKESIYKKDRDSSTDANEKLLESDSINTLPSNSTTPYETVYYTKNFVIASNKPKI